MAKDKDFATGKPVDQSKPEEQVRQDYERVLVESYGYRKSELDIEVEIPRGTGYFPDRADIVVYRSASGRDPARDVWGIVETKRPEKDDGIAQLKSYMTATSAVWAVWTNGNDIEYLFKDISKNAVLEDYLYNIPARGQTVSDIGRLNKSDLRPFQRADLITAFRRILNNLYANTNISRREKLGAEMIKLIFCKIEDEKSFLNLPPDFRVQFGEDPEDVKQRIDGLFKRVKEDLQSDGVFLESETVTLDARSTAWVVGQLERGSLLRTDTDVVGDAFEVFAESRLVGEKGEFFTPRNVVELAVEIASPKPNQTVCDPACGSGGFLIQAMHHIWREMEQDPRYKGSPQLESDKKSMAARTLFGIDKESDLVKIAKAHMSIAGDGKSNVVHDNSLHEADHFTDPAKAKFVVGNAFQRFNFVLTNPPFGTKTKVLASDCANFELGHKWKLEKQSGEYQKTSEVIKRDPYVLFVERCLEMLLDEGTLAIVLPETVLHGRLLGYLRQFIMKSNNLKAVVQLPHNTFRPYCNAKTCVLVLEKGVPQRDTIVMAVPEEMGHDHNGKALYRPGTAEVWDDISVVKSEVHDPDDIDNQFTFTVQYSEIDRNALVPSYYRSKKAQPVNVPAGRTGITLGELEEDGVIQCWDGHGSPSATAKGQGTIPYIRVKDIVNWEMYRNPISMVPIETFQRMTKNKRLPEEGDIIMVRRGSYRIGTVAMASSRDKNVLLTRELLTIRVVDDQNQYGITPFYLLASLSSEFVQAQMSGYVFTDTTLPNLADRWRDLVLPVHDDFNEVSQISNEVEKIIRLKWDAQDATDSLRGHLGDMLVT